ncbi:hypothetical protein IEQ34_003295 [Dendrobium chrysotoxum]|uniref:Uncharacterized protein n=1 Tax=Dendrobium chrysotoxum TaxID=161865 RepID=A0AAV7HIS6_DENCH|nr:hypothetical protein IEQ34_003295 [Dendrobium chrysotoxum]
MIVGDVGVFGIGFEGIHVPGGVLAVMGETTFNYVGIFVGISGEVRCCATAVLAVAGKDLLANVGIVSVM